jgi:hypothetical protein
MEVFIVITFYVCDDHFYGYNESLTCVYGTFEEATEYVQKITNDSRLRYDGEEKNPFLQIIKMTLGHEKQEIVFDSRSTEIKMIPRCNN